MNQNVTKSLRDMPDLMAGVMMVGLGALGLWAGRDLSFGTPAMMGSGFLPRSLSWILIAIGAFVFAAGLRRPRLEIETVNLRPLIILMIAIAGFAIGVQWLGFVVSSAWLIVVGSFADSEARPKEVLIGTVVLVTAGVGIFIYGLGVQMPVWPKL